MKKRLLIVVYILILATWACANANGYVPPALSGWSEQKTIKDPAEYNDYISALNMTDASAKAAAMEAFASKYPASVVRVDALEQAMSAYQQAKNVPKLEQIAGRLLEVDPNNIRALAISAYLARAGATSGNPARLKETCADAQKGIQALPGWSRPDGTTEEDFATLRKQMSQIFYGAAGFCALQNKDYPAAQANFVKSLELDPSDMQNAFQLGIADLQMNPLEATGFWYCGKAISLALAQKNEAGAQSIGAYCKAKYHNYRGTDEGWEQLVAATGAQNSPPAGFAAGIKKRATPAELACQAVAENNPSDLSFSDWEFILQQRDAAPCNLESANKVWAAIQEKEKNGEAKLKITVMVISVSGKAINVAITEDNQEARKADMEVHPEKPMLKPPASGAIIDVIGVISKYQLNPFLFTMEKATYTAAAHAAK
jgi:tetratricopeptide (TPR) repeat protein